MPGPPGCVTTAPSSTAERPRGPRAGISCSQYVVNAFNEGRLQNWQNKGWRNAKKSPVPNRDLWETLLQRTNDLNLLGGSVTFQWVRGHNGDPQNEKCDAIANDEANIAAQSKTARNLVQTEDQGHDPKFVKQTTPIGQNQPRLSATSLVERIL